MDKQTISASLSSDLVARLDALAKETERNRSWLIAKAIDAYLEELEDIRVARERLHEERLSPSEIRKRLGV
jgi:predicted DNA-binding protein